MQTSELRAKSTRRNSAGAGAPDAGFWSILLVSAWPLPGGLLQRLGCGPQEIEAKSRGVARELVRDRWRDGEAELAASVVYAAGDPDLAADIRMGADRVGRARRALAAGGAILVDVTMVAAGIRLPAGRRLAVAVRAPGAETLARDTGTTRAAAGVERSWDEF